MTFSGFFLMHQSILAGPSPNFRATAGHLQMLCCPGAGHLPTLGLFPNFDTHVVSELTLHRGYYWKKVDWLICQGQGVVKACLRLKFQLLLKWNLMTSGNWLQLEVLCLGSINLPSSSNVWYYCLLLLTWSTSLFVRAACLRVWNLQYCHLCSRNLMRTHRLTGRGDEGGYSPPKFWATQIFWAARENFGQSHFLKTFLCVFFFLLV